jgi:hypothetical protein
MISYIKYAIFFIFNWGEPLRSLRSLASGYPLHHLRAFHALGGSAAIPLANTPPKAANRRA